MEWIIEQIFPVFEVWFVLMLYECVHIGQKVTSCYSMGIESFNMQSCVLLLISKVSMLQFRVCICFFFLQRVSFVS